MSEGGRYRSCSREHVGYLVGELAVACGQAAEEILNIEPDLRYNRPIEVGSRGRLPATGISQASWDILGAECILGDLIGRRIDDIHCVARFAGDAVEQRPRSLPGRGTSARCRISMGHRFNAHADVHRRVPPSASCKAYDPHFATPLGTG